MNVAHTYPQPHEQTAGRLIDGEAVLILSDNSEVNVLNRVGSRIFELSDGTHSVAAIAAVLADEYDVAPEQALADVVDFVRQLSAQNILRLVENPPPHE